MMRIILLLLLTFYVSNVSLIKTTSHADLIRQSILNISETSQWAKLNRRKMVKNQVERILNIEIIRGRLNLFKTTPRNTNTSYLLNKNVRITVSWIKRVKGVLDHIMMDSKILPIQSEKWISLDILVMDGNQKTLPTNEYIVPMNCSDTTTLAFPSIIEAKDGNINSKLYPLLDILIVELPNFTDYLKKIPVSHERISNTNHNYNHGYLMKFPILDISPKVSRGDGLYHSLCIPSFIEKDRVSGFWSLMFVISKVPELGDTLFIILRKQRLIFLHWYHHVTVLLYSWYSYSEYTAVARWFIVMNYLVHSLMYSYYTFKNAQLNILVFETTVVIYNVLSNLQTYCVTKSKNNNYKLIL
ncbi:ELOVL6 [Lepeophtheirus salmonis]|uniref:Elongation of very long chain fatty acids protein n=1 Tax=Lepeophtheirus salmonis TaxID=72036 RepID=A0A7R8CMA8_LEPSM|nr:ELOVL6 [Lepeophtheirus salmonis]CAF2819802.1 ELOVL6 [Lepeophtheirus salmonis]